ncbi:flavin-containing monooxygenase [Geodermatophilus sp. SYSU D00705]
MAIANSRAGLEGAVDVERLAEYLKDAHLPSLIPALAFASGDLSLLREEFRPGSVSAAVGLGVEEDLSWEIQAAAREMCAEAIVRLRQQSGAAADGLSDADVGRIMEYMVGPVPEGYLPVLLHQLGHPRDVSAPTWTKQELAPDRPFRVAVIGAGMSGLATAHRLTQAGIPFVVFERQSELGGVWTANDYPGCRLDTSNFAYSYSFYQQGDWKDNYSRREEIWDYLKRCARDLGLEENIRFRTEVVSARWDDDTSTWAVRVRTDGRPAEELRFQAVISAVGQLSEPNIPTIEGLDRFQGATWHTAEWDKDVDLTGKRVAVVGTGASAFQVIPKVAEVAETVTVFQRTPPWVVPSPGYNSPLPTGQAWLFANVPHYHRWFRVHQFFTSIDSRRPYAVVDPEWDHPVSVSAKNEALRQGLLAHLERSLGDRPDVLAKVTPAYPPYAKRMLRDDGLWMETLKRDDVHIVTEAIARANPTGLQTVDGTVHEVDVIVFGTGFRASDFLSSISVTGRDGIDLHEQWGGDARAYYGISVPDFPNLFCLYGPNTNLIANGSLVMFSEAAIDYVLACIRMLFDEGRDAIQVDRRAFEEFNERIDAACRSMAYGLSSVNSWYKNATGRVSQNWPLHSLEYWKGTHQLDRGDFELL